MRFRKYDTVFILHNTDFPTYTENQNTIPKHKFYFVNRETKTKLFLAVIVKIDFSMHIIFYENSFAVAVCAHELSWHKILFSNLNWNQFFEWGTHLYMLLFLSTHPPIHCTPYLWNHTSSDHNLWYTCVKWWYLQGFFSFFKFWIFQLLVG